MDVGLVADQIVNDWESAWSSQSMLYSKEARERLRMTVAAKLLGMSNDTIAALVAMNQAVAQATAAQQQVTALQASPTISVDGTSYTVVQVRALVALNISLGPLGIHL